MKIGETMLTLVYSARLNDPVQRCAEVMSQEKIGFLPVLDTAGTLVGVVTDRDLVVRVLAEGRSALTPISEVMTPGPLMTCSPDDDLVELERKMSAEKKARAVVINASKQPIGVISLSDVARADRVTQRVGSLLATLVSRESVAIQRHS